MSQLDLFGNELVEQVQPIRATPREGCDSLLMLGDCLERMREIEDGSVDLTVTSPPYDNLRTYNGNNVLWCEQVWQDCIKELYRVTKTGGAVVWVVGDATIKGSETGTSFKQALWAMQCGFNLHDTMIYNKGSCPFPGSIRYSQIFEYMFIWSKGKPTFNPICDRKNKHAGTGMKATTNRQVNGTLTKTSLEKNHTNRKIKEVGARFNIWEISPGWAKSHTDKLAYEHPATFPEQIAHDHIISWSNKCDTVLDPFMGSGTTGKMANHLGRKFIGIEMDEGYFEIGRKRILDACGIVTIG